MKSVFAALVLCSFAFPVAADDALWRDCRTCHQVAAPDGTVLARGGRAGPNLYGVAGRVLAGDSDFRLYSTDLQRAGQTGARWTKGNFIDYLAGPDQFLQRVTGQPLAESGMHVSQPANGGALFDYLQGLSR